VKQLQAQIVLEYNNEKIAAAVCEAISPDNVKTPKGLSISTAKHGKNVVTEIIFQGKFPTFLATIDDLLFSASTAERSIMVARNLR
jgi:hypothetical protein